MKKIVSIVLTTCLCIGVIGLSLGCQATASPSVNPTPEATSTPITWLMTLAPQATPTPESTSTPAATPITGVTATPSAAFSDVKASDPYSAGVQYVCQNKLMKGITDTTFEPNQDIDLTTLITALYGYSVKMDYDVSKGEDTNILSYDDATKIPEGAAEAFQWACGSGLVPLDEKATSIGVNKPVTKEQLVTILYRYALLYSIEPKAGEDTNILSYDDVSDITIEEAYAAFQWACTTDIIDTADTTKLSPKASITRGELAGILLQLSTLSAE